MNTPAEGDTFVAQQIERLAREGVRAGELLSMLPEEVLHAAIRLLAREAYLAQMRPVLRVLQTELDERP